MFGHFLSKKRIADITNENKLYYELKEYVLSNLFFSLPTTSIKKESVGLILN